MVNLSHFKHSKLENQQNKPERKVPKYFKLKQKLDSIDQLWLNKLYRNLKYACDYYQTNDLINTKYERQFQSIRTVIISHFPSDVQLFGSIVNGFGTKQSDLDISVNFNHDKDLSHNEMISRLTAIYEVFKTSNLFSKIIPILTAKIPLIKFVTKENMHGDICINNYLACENTNMLKFYNELDDYVPKLGIIIKCMTNRFGIKEASKGTLSSYAYIIMLIHFLQKRGILPVLQELFEGERPTRIVNGCDVWFQSDIQIIKKLWKSKSVPRILSNLFIDFLKYYVMEFDIDREVVTIRQSAALLKSEKDWENTPLAIEDPFDTSHNLSRFLCKEKYRIILECFRNVLLEKGDFNRINSRLVKSDAGSDQNDFKENKTNFKTMKNSPIDRNKNKYSDKLSTKFKNLTTNQDGNKFENQNQLNKLSDHFF